MDEILVPIIENSNKINKKRKGMAPRKKKMVEAMAKHLGIVTSACQEVGLNRDTYYQWLKNDKDFAYAISELDGRKEDVIEKAFLSLVIDRNPQAVIHAVKTKLKHRGYGEEVSKVSVVTNAPTYSLEIIRPDDNKIKMETKSETTSGV
jgi:hypothetical protein